MTDKEAEFDMRLQQLEANQIVDKQIITALLASHPYPNEARAMWRKLAANMQTTTGLFEIGRGLSTSYRQLMIQETNYWEALLRELAGPEER